jgi:hypothetical protein
MPSGVAHVCTYRRAYWDGSTTQDEFYLSKADDGYRLWWKLTGPAEGGVVPLIGLGQLEEHDQAGYIDWDSAPLRDWCLRYRNVLDGPASDPVRDAVNAVAYPDGLPTREDVMGRMIEWRTPDGGWYEWAVDRHWVQDRNKYEAKLQKALEAGHSGPLFSPEDFLTSSRSPEGLIAALSTLDTDDAELASMQAQLLADAQHGIDLRQGNAPRGASGCLAAVLVSLVPGAVLLLSLT